MTFTPKRLTSPGIDQVDSAIAMLLNVVNFEASNSYKESCSILCFGHLSATDSTETQNYVNSARVFYNRQLRAILYGNNTVVDRLNLSPSLNKQLSVDSERVYSVTANNNLLTSEITTSSQLLSNWSLESRFVARRNLKSPTAVFVLATAPMYRMSRLSNTPISTSQFYGNLYNDTAYINARRWQPASGLFAKSTINTIALSFSRPRKPYNPVLEFSETCEQDCSNSINQVSVNLRRLLHVRPALAVLNKSDGLNTLNQRKNEKLLLNMRQVTRSRSQKRWSKNTKQKTFKRQKFTRKLMPSFLRKARLMMRDSRRRLKRSYRFVKWKTKKFTLFFSRFSRTNKTRKNLLKVVTKNNYVSSKYMKYGYLNKSSERPNTEISLISNHINIQNSQLKSNYLQSALTQQLDLSHSQVLWLVLLNPILLKSYVFNNSSHKLWAPYLDDGDKHARYSNLVPNKAFRKSLSKKVLNSLANRKFREDLIPLYQNTVIRFIEFCTGKKALFQFYPFVNQHISKDYIVRYKRWLPRMGFYERRLGHRFFLEESLHIIHISFVLRDPKILASWLRAMILRISFWKTRSIFRFLKYLFHNYFTHVFDDVKIKGLKIRLKGKISAAGNSRKRTILYRIGKTSHSEVDLRVVKNFSLVNTFTGVMGFQVYLFY